MLKGFNKDGEIRNVLVTDEGEIMVKGAEGGGQWETQQAEIINTSENPVPVELQGSINIGNTNLNPIPVVLPEDTQTTLYSSVEEVTNTPTTIAINKKVTTIDVANYSDNNSVTITIGQKEYEIGNNITTTLFINDNVTNIVLEATQSTKMQIIVTGVN